MKEQDEKALPPLAAFAAVMTTKSTWMKAIFSALLFGLVAWAGIEFSRYGGRIAAFWPANGLLLAILMTTRKEEHLPHLLLAYIANVTVNLFTGDTPAIACFLATCNAVEIGCALLLMRAHSRIDWVQLEYPETLLKFAVVVCVLAPILSSGLAAVGLAYLTNAHASSVLINWFISDAMGLAIVTPTTLMLRRVNLTKVLHGEEFTRGAALVAVLLGITLVAFAQSRYPFLFLIFPPLIFATFYSGFTGAAIGVFGISVIAIACTNMGLGPIMLIANLGLSERLFLLQAFLLVVVMTIFPLASVLSEHRRRESRLIKRAATDALTGLANRGRFQEFMEAEWSSACRAQSPVSIAMIDVDYFKRYNDMYGHQQGDKCLAAIGDILSEIVRRPSDLVARFGGEEFILVLPNTPLKGALSVAESIHNALAVAHLDHHGSLYRRITVSVGVSAAVPKPRSDASDLIAAADRALYEAKGAGRSRTETATYKPSVSHISPNTDHSNGRVIKLKTK